jgi:hypothetical protein
MPKNQKSKNNAISKLYNVLDYNSKKDVNKNERYLGSLSHRLKEISGEEIVYKKKFENISKPDNGESLKPKVKIHAREIKKAPKIPIVKIEEKKREYRDQEIFEIKKLKVKEPEFIEVKPKSSNGVLIDVSDLKADKEQLPEWDSIETVKKEEEFEEISKKESISEKAEPEIIEQIKPIKEVKKVKEDIKKTCPECGKKIENSQDICSDCGKELKDEKIPTFIPVKKVEKEEITSEWEPIEIEKPKEEKTSKIEIKEEKITVFKDIKCIDDKTASLLFKNGITTISLLDKATIKELSKIEGLKKKTVKKIKKELKERNKISEKTKKIEVTENESDEWSIPQEPDSKSQVWEPIEEESKESTIVEEYSSDIQIKKHEIDPESKIEPFKEVKSIDNETATLFFDNGYTTADSLIEAPIKNLKKIKGIKKKKLKEIKNELEGYHKPQAVVPIEIKEETKSKDDNDLIKEELDSSKKELKTISKELNTKEKNIQKLQNELDEKIKELETKKTEVYNKDEELKLLQNQSEGNKLEYEAGLEEFEKKKEEMELIKKELEDKKIDLESKINEIENRDEEIIELQNKLKQKTEEIESESEQINKKDVEIEKINNDLISKTDELEEKNRIITELKDELSSKQKDLERKDKEIKINAFKGVNSIDEKTALLLYDNGITTIESLKEIPQKNITKIKGIKRKTAKEIKKELEGKSEIKPVKIQKTELNEEPTEHFVEKKEVSNELKMKKDKKLKEHLTDENNLTKEEATDVDKKIADEFSLVVIDDDIFEDIDSIDQETSKLLKDNGINTVDALKEASIRDLTRIKGIKRKQAKIIKKEISKLTKENTDIDTIKSPEIVNEQNVEEEEAEWEYYDENLISKSKLKEVKGFRYKDYTLYEKEIKMKSGRKRPVRFFSKAEPDDAEPIELPKGYEVKKNKKTGLPYLRKKK